MAQYSFTDRRGMMQFFEAIIRHEQGNEDVLNTLWYRRNSVGLPTAADQAALASALASDWQAALKPITTADLKYRDVTVWSYDEDWNRVPFNPSVAAMSGVGAGAGPAGPPLQVIVIGFRLEPTVPGLQPDPLNPGGSYILKPVRRGYLAISGIAEADMDASGLVNPNFLVAAPVAAFCTFVADKFVIGTAAEEMEPIRVSKPPQGVQTRGYALVLSAAPRTAVSTRRSRKVGKGG
jgi:hypothetical protein